MKTILSWVLVMKIALGGATEASFVHDTHIIPRPESSLMAAETCPNPFAFAPLAPQCLPLTQPIERNPGWVFWVTLMGGMGVWLGHRIIREKQEKAERARLFMQEREDRARSLIREREDRARRELRKAFNIPMESNMRELFAKCRIDRDEDAPLREGLDEDSAFAVPVEFFSSPHGQDCYFTIKTPHDEGRVRYGISLEDLVRLKGLTQQRWSALRAVGEKLKEQHASHKERDKDQQRADARAIRDHVGEYIQLSDFLACAHLKHRRA